MSAHFGCHSHDYIQAGAFPSLHEPDLAGEIRALRNELHELVAQLRAPPLSLILTGREVVESYKQLRGA